MQEPPPPPERARIPASLLKDLPPQQGRADGWDRDKALAQGREALRKARAADGVDGDALREYTELVLYLMEEQGGKTKP